VLVVQACRHQLLGALSRVAVAVAVQVVPMLKQQRRAQAVQAVVVAVVQAASMQPTEQPTQVVAVAVQEPQTAVQAVQVLLPFDTQILFLLQRQQQVLQQLPQLVDTGFMSGQVQGA
jgi:hypothetical protein